MKVAAGHPVATSKLRGRAGEGGLEASWVEAFGVWSSGGLAP